MALLIDQRRLVADDGERFSPLLAHDSARPLASAEPLFRPSVFAVAMRRSAGLPEPVRRSRTGNGRAGADGEEVS